MTIENIQDHMAYAHTCGSVHFNLLRSGKIECAGCGEVTDFVWVKKEKWYGNSKDD